MSFFPLGGDVTGLTLEGFKYSLDHYRLTTADSGLTVSNEIVSEKAKVTYQSGTLLMIMVIPHLHIISGYARIMKVQ